MKVKLNRCWVQYDWDDATEEEVKALLALSREEVVAMLKRSSTGFSRYLFPIFHFTLSKALSTRTGCDRGL